MRSNNMEKAFIDSSWKEMKGILDNEMPIEKNRKALFIWFFGLLFLITLVIAGIQLYNKNIPQKKIPPVIAGMNQDVKIKENSKNEAFADTENELKDEIDNSMNYNSEIEGTVSNRNYIHNGMNVNHNAIQKSSENLYEFEIETNAKDNQYDGSVAVGMEKRVVDHEIQLQTLESNHFLSKLESNLPRLAPQERIFSDLSIFNQIKPIVPSEVDQKRMELSISSRIYDQSELNGELGLHYNLMNRNFSIMPGIGFGYDGYHSSREGIMIDDNTLISSNVRNLNSLEVSAPSFSASGPIELNQNRSFYLSPQLNLRKRISKSLFLKIGVLSRIYTKVEQSESSVLVDTPGAGSLDPESEKDNQSVENSLDLHQDQQNEYLTAGLGWAIKESLSLDVNFLHQMDKSLSLRPYNVANSGYNNVLEKVNRNEIRIGVSYKF